MKLLRDSELIYGRLMEISEPHLEAATDSAMSLGLSGTFGVPREQSKLGIRTPAMVRSLPRSFRPIGPMVRL